MKTTFGVQFYCRESKKNKDGLAPLELSLNVNQQRLFLNLPTKFSPKEFNKKRRPKEIEDIITQYRVRVNEVIAEIMGNGFPLTANTLREYMKNGGTKTYTIQTLYDDYMSMMKKRVGVDLTKGAYRKYEIALGKFMEFVNPNTECATITNNTIQQLYADLNSKYDKSTTAGMMTKIKSLIKFAMDNNKIKINPFLGIKITKVKKHITYLTNEEIEAIKGLKLENKSLDRVRDIFILLCGTGLSYCDLNNLKQDDIKEQGGTYYIKKNRQKTGEEFTAVILPFALPIALNLPKIMSNQKLNVYLKVIADLAGINKNLHLLLNFK